MNGYVMELHSLEDLMDIISGVDWRLRTQIEIMRRGEAASNYAFKPLEEVVIYNSLGIASHVMVPQPEEIANIRPLLQFAADQRGDGDVSRVTPPIVRIVPLKTLWEYTQRGASGAFFQEIGEIWMACPYITQHEANIWPWFNGTLVHELTHFLQLRSRGFDLKADLAVDLCDREFEAMRAQRNYLLLVGNKSWITALDFDEDDLRMMVEDDYGQQADSQRYIVNNPASVFPEYRGPRS